MTSEDLQTWADNHTGPDAESYLPHLDTETFDQTVRFRIRGENKNDFLPTADIEQLLSQRFELTRTKDFDIAQTIDEPRVDYAIDGTATNPVEVLQAVADHLQQYNAPPEELPAEKRSEWSEITLVDVSITTTPYNWPYEIRAAVAALVSDLEWQILAALMDQPQTGTELANTFDVPSEELGDGVSNLMAGGLISKTYPNDPSMDESEYSVELSEYGERFIKALFNTLGDATKTLDQ